MSKIQEYWEFQGNLNLKTHKYVFGSEQTQWQGEWSALPGSLKEPDLSMLSTGWSIQGPSFSDIPAV